MYVLKVLDKSLSQGLSAKMALESLECKLGITHSVNPDYPDLFCLNYSMINSPKHHVAVRECRSLVIRLTDLCFVLESRSMDRFFNIGEASFEPTQFAACMEKLDGSVLSIWFSEKYQKLMYRTRSQIMPVDVPLFGSDITWDELVEPLLPPMALIRKGLTYICELTSPHNRVVKPYLESKISLLAMRSNLGSNSYLSYEALTELIAGTSMSLPKRYPYCSVKGAQEGLQGLQGLDEGFVLYNFNMEPVLKVKSPKYLRAHLLRGNTQVGHKRALSLILEGEDEEYLSVFPEDAHIFKPIREALSAAQEDVELALKCYGSIEGRKEFAVAVKDHTQAPILFTLRRATGGSYLPAFRSLRTKHQLTILKNYMK